MSQVFIVVIPRQIIIPFNNFNSYISQIEIQKISSLHFQKDKKLALVSALLKRYVVNKILNINIRNQNILNFNPLSEFSKPELRLNSTQNLNVDISNYKFNTSHHSNTVAVAARNDNIEIGIDIAVFDPLPSWLLGDQVDHKDNNLHVNKNENQIENLNNILQSFNQVLSPYEINFIKSSSLNYFGKILLLLTNWALKESYFKAIGTGLLDSSLTDASFHNIPNLFSPNSTNSFYNTPTIVINNTIQKNWSFYVKVINSNAILAIASHNSNDNPPHLISLSYESLISSFP